MLRYAKYIIPSAVIILILGFIFIDKPLILWAASLPKWVRETSRFIDTLYHPIVFLTGMPLIFYFYTFMVRKTRISREILFIVIAVPAAVLVIDILKTLIGRSRPDLLLTKGIYTFHPFAGLSNNWRSLPSGHSSAISGFMAALSCFRPHFTWLFFLIALLFSFLRIISLEHYFTDIWATIFIAFYVVRLLYLPYQRLRPLELQSRTSSRRSGS